MKRERRGGAHIEEMHTYRCATRDCAYECVDMWPCAAKALNFSRLPCSILALECCTTEIFSMLRCIRSQPPRGGTAAACGSCGGGRGTAHVCLRVTPTRDIAASLLLFSTKNRYHGSSPPDASCIDPPSLSQESPTLPCACLPSFFSVTHHVIDFKRLAYRVGRPARRRCLPHIFESSSSAVSHQLPHLRPPLSHTVAASSTLPLLIEAGLCHAL